jgi:hypothetical protein
VQIEDLRDPNDPAYTLTGLDEGRGYFFAVTAYDDEGFESEYSNEAATPSVAVPIMTGEGDISYTVTTSNVPIGAELSKKYPTNWELSAARATNVARYLQEKIGINPSLLSATGYGEYQPVAPNETKEGRSKNRRIEIVLVPKEVLPVSRK